MENLVTSKSYWKNRKVFITGHTGFKGSWLSIILKELGAIVCGYSLEPATSPSLFHAAHVEKDIQSIIGDVRDLNKLKKTIKNFQPETVFHLAAQAIVSQSYKDPIETYTTNVIGTANILEALRDQSTVESAVIVTTDKCYENNEWVWAYREIDRLGGRDPYSSSKACTELITSAYRDSFFRLPNKTVISTARAGNVIGGGDWSKDRLIPDLIRSFENGEPCNIRNPNAIRPWQHVLEPLTGYLLLAEKSASNPLFAEAWNFGPNQQDSKTVRWLANQLCKLWGEGVTWKEQENHELYESRILSLDSSKACTLLGWKPRTDAQKAVELSISWYKAFMDGQSAELLTRNQVNWFINEKS